jgi:ectoine hydroxylase-related dioxygenase (phytanoyl-CoA dioxygenase family)
MLEPGGRALFLERGYLIVPDVLSRQDRAHLELEVERLREVRPSASQVYETLPPATLERSPSARHDALAFDTIRSAWPLTREGRDVLFGHRLRSLVRDLLGNEAVLFNEQYIVKPSRSGTYGAFGWHRDSDSVVRATGENKIPYISVWVALDDATESNGCLVVRPLGSDDDDEVLLEVASGTAIVMSSLLWHRSGPNTTQFSRRAWMPQFSSRAIIHPESGIPISLSIPLSSQPTPSASHT